MATGTETIQGLLLSPTLSPKLNPFENGKLNIPTIQLDHLGHGGRRLTQQNDLSGIPPVCPVSHGEGRELVNNRIIPADVQTVFDMIFTDSVFFADFHAARKNYDLSLGEWQKGEDGKEVRLVSMMVALNGSVGPKTVKVSETQVMSVSQPGKMYVIDVEQVQGGIPFADSFYITSHFCLTRVGEEQTKLCIVNQIKYKKSVWKTIKGFIEKNTWAGLEEFYANLANALQEECEKRIGETTRGLTRSNTPLRSRRLTRKRPAPDVPRVSQSLSGGSEPVEQTSSKLVKFTLGLLLCLLFLNTYLYFRLAKVENSASRAMLMDQGELLQEQEDLHRLEIQKWHKALFAASKLLQQAEDDMQTLKFQIASYETQKFDSKNSKRERNSAQENLEKLHNPYLKF